MISVVINADTRPESETLTGEPLHGVRSRDFLIDGVKNKMNFFRGHEVQCILYIDYHEKLDSHFFYDIEALVHSYGNNSKVIFKSHDRNGYRWYDHIYLAALKLAEGDYIVHFDQDCNAFRKDDCDIIERYFKWLDEGYKYICQPAGNGSQDFQAYYASTRFFICKRETLDFPLIEKSLYQTNVNGKYTCCLEQTLGALAGEGKVLYPPREDDKYIIFSWAKYFNGTLAKLNEMNYDKIELYINQRGIHGANDLIDSL